MTKFNALLLGIAGGFFIIILTSVHFLIPLYPPHLLRFIDGDGSEIKKLQQSKLDINLKLSGLNQYKPGHKKNLRAQVLENNFIPKFIYRPLLNNQHFLFVAKNLEENDSVDKGQANDFQVSQETTNSDKVYISSSESKIQTEHNRDKASFSTHNSNNKIDWLLWVETGDDPAFLKEEFSPGIIQFYKRPLEPLLKDADTKADLPWTKGPRHILKGGLVMTIYDVGLLADEKSIDTLTAVYSIYNPNHLAKETWLRVYYLNFELSEVPLYLDLILPGLGEIDQVAISRGSITFSRIGDQVLFWTGVIPPFSCALKPTPSCLKISFLQGPPASRLWPSISAFSRQSVSSPRTLIHLNSARLNGPKIATAKTSLEDGYYKTSIEAWIYPLKDESSTDNLLWKRVKLYDDITPFYQDSFRSSVESVSYDTLIESLTVAPLLPSPISLSLSTGVLVASPYSQKTTHIKVLEEDIQEFHVSNVQILDSAHSAFVYPYNHNALDLRPKIFVREDANMALSSLVRHMFLDHNSNFLVIQYGEYHLLCSRSHFDGGKLPNSQFLITSEDILFKPILKSVVFSYQGNVYLILLHPGGTLSSWSLTPPLKTKVLELNLPFHSLFMITAMIVVVGLFVNNEYKIPHG